MKTNFDIRRDNVRLLMSIKSQQQKDFAESIKMAQSQLTHIIGANPKRNIGDDLARDIERRLNIEVGWLDNIHYSEDMDDFIERIMRLNKDGIEFMAVQLDIAESIISRKSYQKFTAKIANKRHVSVRVKLNRRISAPHTD